MSYNEVKRILSGFDEIARMAEDIRSHKEARLRVVSQPFLAQAVLPHAFAAFADAHPGLRYSLEIRSRGDVGSWIAGHQFDLGVDEVFSELNLPLTIRAETSSGLSACQMVAKGLGISLADALVARCLPPGQIELREWDPGLSLTYGFLYSSAHLPLSPVPEFAEIVAATTKKLSP